MKNIHRKLIAIIAIDKRKITTQSKEAGLITSQAL